MKFIIKSEAFSERRLHFVFWFFIQAILFHCWKLEESYQSKRHSRKNQSENSVSNDNDKSNVGFIQIQKDTILFVFMVCYRFLATHSAARRLI